MAIPRVMTHMLQMHLVHNKYDKNIENRSINEFIKGLDPIKLYFLSNDVVEIKKSLRNLYKKLRRGNCRALLSAYQKLIKRVEERAKYALKYVDTVKSLDKTIEITLDDDKRKYLNTVEQLNKYHEKYIQFQVANFLASDMTMKEAKARFKRRYERNLKNLKTEQLHDIYTRYLDALASSLDPHSSYFSNERLEDFNINMSLELDGIGASLSSQDGYTVVEQLIPGGAAARSGLLELEDKIIAVAQGKKGKFEPIVDMPLSDVVRKIRGKRGTKVRLKILRKEGKKRRRFNITLVRRKIKLEEEAAQIHFIDRKIGKKKHKLAVLNLPSFYADSKSGRSASKDVKKLLKKARKNKVEGLVLDLSQNGGGSLDVAVNLAGLFFKVGNVVKTYGHQDMSDTLADTDSGVGFSKPLIILTSRLSASASEIVAGALQDYKRSIVVGGDHTFGKGSVQQVLPIPPYGAIKVTNGMFFIPGGNSTQHRGVEADIVLPGVFSKEDIGERYTKFSLPAKQIAPFLSEGAYVTEGSDSWTSVKAKEIEKLRKLSKVRVTKDKDFKKILKELKEDEERGQKIKISEVLDMREERKENKKKRRLRNDSKYRKKEYLKRADVNEAVNILVDLLQIRAKDNSLAKKEKI